MGACMLFEVLGALEGLAAVGAGVRLEWRVDAEVGGDVVALGTHDAAAGPVAGEAEIVGALAADVVGA